MGIFIFNRAIAGSVWAGARRALAFLCIDAFFDRAVHRAAWRHRRGASDFDRQISGPAKFSNRAGSDGPSPCSRWRPFGGRQTRPWMNCSTSARSRALDQLLAKTRFTMFPFLPSYWLSSAVLQWAEGILRGSAFFALVLLSNTLFFGGIAFTRFGNLFYDTASAVQSRAGGNFKLNFLPTQKYRPQSIGLLEKDRREIFLVRPRAHARWPSKTCGCSGATRRNGASP